MNDFLPGSLVCSFVFKKGHLQLKQLHMDWNYWFSPNIGKGTCPLKSSSYQKFNKLNKFKNQQFNINWLHIISSF